MNEQEIRKYASLMKELELTGLEITDDNKVVRLERTLSMPIKEQVTSKASAETKANEEDTDCNYISIKSPMVGVFYVAPAENADAFVSVGEKIEKGRTLCIIESMKLMNEIPSDVDGVVEKVCVANGQVVDFGTELFRIRR